MPSYKYFVVRVVVAIVFATAGSQADGADLYAVTQLPIAFQPVALNDSGQIVGIGNLGRSDFAFLYTNGASVMIASGYSSANDINDAGQVVGSLGTNYFAPVSAFSYSNGAITNLGTLSGGGSSAAVGINASGDIVGTAAVSPSSNNSHVFVYRNGAMTDLGTLPGTTSSRGSQINDAGQIVGTASYPNGATHAFLYSAGAFTDLGTLPGATASFASGINDAGQVIGTSFNSAINTSHGFLYADGTMIDIGTLGGQNTYVAGINKAGQVVGNSSTATSPSGDAFLYANGVMVDLNSAIDASLGINLIDAVAINNLGQIVAEGVSGGTANSYLLTPVSVPEPAACLTCGSGLLLLAVLRRRIRRRVGDRIR